MAGLASVYLFAGDDAGKIDAMLTRLRSRAEQEGGPGALETFGTDGTPDPEDLVGSIPALSLTASHRYLLADGVERWNATQAKAVVAALEALPEDLTIVLVAREEPPRTKAPKALVDGVGKLDRAEIRRCDAPKARDLPARLQADARARGFELDKDAAELLVHRLGPSTMRLSTELDRLALWAGAEGEVTAEDLEAMIADTSEEAMWTLSDAIIDGDGATAAGAAARLNEQGEAVTPLVYAMARRLREARMALDGLEGGKSPRDLEGALPMHPYAAKLLLRRVKGSSPRKLRAATCSVADLEWWTRGGSDYPEDVALALAVARATRPRGG